MTYRSGPLRSLPEPPALGRGVIFPPDAPIGPASVPGCRGGGDSGDSSASSASVQVAPLSQISTCYPAYALLCHGNAFQARVVA
jgi:hypothetical protein